jgi:tRNA uridine 5-carboxymethylaminomethyl modification enzyme
MRGFENCVVSRPGYAVEYDYVEPTQLFPSLETKRVAGLFNAGQINGTSGYEEAAGQGLVAGINAGYYARAHIEQCGPLVKATSQSKDVNALAEALESAQKEAGFDAFRKIPEYKPLILGRDEAYIGVLIDDLVTLGTKEPYRMFTARAEYRLKLRHDTADRRLSEKAFEAGLKTKEQMERLSEKYEAVEKAILLLSENDKAQNPGFSQSVWDLAQEDFKYRYYIQKQDARIAKMHKMENAKIPADFDYGAIPSLSAESRMKLEKIRPLTLGQAGRISGIRNSDIMLLMVYLR